MEPIDPAGALWGLLEGSIEKSLIRRYIFHQQVSIMATQAEFCDRILKQLNQVAPVTVRAMFGGYGLYCESIMFALVADTTLYFKVGDENRQDYLDAGMEPFIYYRQGKPIQMSYYRLPDAVLEDAATLVQWVDKACHVVRCRKK